MMTRTNVQLDFKLEVELCQNDTCTVKILPKIAQNFLVSQKFQHFYSKSGPVSPNLMSHLSPRYKCSAITISSRITALLTHVPVQSAVADLLVNICVFVLPYKSNQSQPMSFICSCLFVDVIITLQHFFSREVVSEA